MEQAFQNKFVTNFTAEDADCRRILGKLKEKSTFVQWNNGTRKEYFGLVAKKIKDKERLRDEGFIVYDLDDL